MFNKIFKKIKLSPSSVQALDSEILAEIEKVERCFRDERLMDFFSKYQDLLSARNSPLHFTTFGINLKDGKVDSVKFYAHFLEEMTEDELREFIPETKDYLTFLDFKSKGDIFKFENIGTVLEIKFKTGNDQPAYGFFYQLRNADESFDKIGFPEKLPQKLRKACTSLGINYEYGIDKIKKYYYFNPEPATKAFFEEKMDLSIINEVKFIEYAESDEFYKVNLYTGQIDDFCNKVKTFTDQEVKLIDFLLSKYNLTNTTYGFYENKSLKSVYFRVSDLKINSNHHQTDTLTSLVTQSR